jgi:hypothetical protein
MAKLLFFTIFLIFTIPIAAMEEKFKNHHEICFVAQEDDTENNYFHKFFLIANRDIFAKDDTNGDTELIIAVRHGYMGLAMQILENARLAPELISLTGSGFVNAFAEYPDFKGKAKIKEKVFMFLCCMKKLKKHNIYTPKFLVFEIIKLTFAESIYLARLLQEENNEGHTVFSFCSHNNNKMSDLIEKYKKICNLEESFWQYIYNALKNKIRCIL